MGACRPRLHAHPAAALKPSKRTGSALREMLEAVSYKKELILSIYADGEGLLWDDQITQLHDEVLKAGFGHL